MKISELITTLEGLQEEHGNVDVLCSFGKVQEVNMSEECLDVFHTYKGNDVWRSYLLITGPEN